MAMPSLSDYALCDAEDVAELLGYTDAQMSDRMRTLITVINGATTAIRRRSQREFKQTDAELGATRWVEISQIDLDRGYVRLGDYSAWPSVVRLYNADRSSFEEYDTNDDGTGDLWPLPDVPEPGHPYEYLKVKRLATPSLYVGAWLSVETDWGFPVVPDDIRQIVIATAAQWVLNDVMKLSELARQQGRPLQLTSLIPREFLGTVDSYRLFRVA